MYEIEMQEMSEDFLECWRAAGAHLNRRVDGGIRSWLRAHPYPPFLEHLSFRLGNQLFFVRVEDADGKVEGPGSLRGLESAARAANGRACILLMRKKMIGEAWVASKPGWGLSDAMSGEPIDPAALVSDEKIEMTPWEIHDMSVQVVRDYLEKQGFDLMSWHGNPNVDPSIWFVGESKKPEWVVVRSVTFPQNAAEQPSNWKGIAESCAHLSKTGHFASVAIASTDQPFTSSDEAPVPLWRGYGMYVRFTGLEKFHPQTPTDISANPVRFASRFGQTEEETDAVQNPMRSLGTRAHNELGHTENHSKHAQTQDGQPSDQFLAFAKGMPLREALLSFKSNVNCTDTIFSTDHWLQPKLAELATILSDPISEDQAKALDDVLHGRHFVKDIIDWLRTSHLPWADYFEDLKTQEMQGQALKREQRVAWGEAQRKRWTGATLSELCLNSVGTMLRGYAIAGTGVPESARKFPNFLAWWFAVGKSTPDESSGWMRISGPWATLGRVELISNEEWAALDPTERDKLTKWIESLGLMLYD